MRGHIRKRGEESWELRWYVGRGPDGKKKYKTKTVRGRKSDAQKELNRILTETARGTYVEPTKMTVAEYVQRWLEDIRGTIKDRTHEWYATIMVKHVLPRIGHVALAKLTPLDVQDLYRQLLDADVSPARVNACHRTLKCCLNQAVRWELIARNPASLAEPPRPPKREVRTLTPKQVRKLLDAARPTGQVSLYMAAVATGMRLGELLALRWQDVDLKGCVISVTGSLDLHGHRDTTKTDSGFRRIAIPKALVDEIDCLPRNGEYVWCTPEGKPLSHWNLNRQFKGLLTKAGLPDIRFHDLRHTHATVLLSQSTHPKVVQERLGHSSINVTMDIYSHVMPDIQRKAADQIGKALGLEKPKNTKA